MSAHKFDPKDFDRLKDPSRLGMIDLGAVVRRFGLRGRIALADVGAGSGIFSEANLRLLPEALCHAFDIVPAMVEWMAANRPDAKTGRLVPMLMPEDSIPLPAGSADFVFMITLHHELMQPVELFRECLRILRPGGGILDADWSPGWAGQGPPREHRVDMETAATHLAQAGFAKPWELDASDRLYCLAAWRPGVTSSS